MNEYSGWMESKGGQGSPTPHKVRTLLDMKHALLHVFELPFNSVYVLYVSAADGKERL